MIDQIELKELVARVKTCLGAIDAAALEADKKSLLGALQLEETLKNPSVAKKVGADLKSVETRLGLVAKANSSLEIIELFNTPENESEIKAEIKVLTKIIDELEVFAFYNGDYDAGDALVEIHAGAGGEDAQDWAEMLALMYQKYAAGKGYGATILEATDGDGAGIKSETIKISGAFAYGNLKGETGVHRLVRISPFDSNKRRHTSFASVQVLPAVEENENIEINPEDLNIVTFRSGGAGGQHVNKTESAVRITHIPTGVVLSCQNERSQVQNKEQAMKMLISKLTAIAEEDAQAKKGKVLSMQKKIEWGNQIRSYVFAPYTQVKDLRSGIVTSSVDKVMDGDLDEFILAELKLFK